MISPLRKNSVFVWSKSQIVITHSGLSTQPLPKPNFQEEWKNAADYKSMPGLTKFQLIRAFAPGGRFYKVQLMDIYKELRQQFGDIFKFPATFGRSEVVTVFNPEDFEKVFRNEGKYPYRCALEALHHYRKKIRPDIYGEFGSLTSEQDEDWHKMRTLVNPVLMKPKTVQRCLPQVDQISQEFITMMLKMRDEKSEVPANFIDYLNMWSLESITNISINQRLGILNAGNQDEKAKQLIALTNKFFTMGYQFEIQPPVWKYYKTKAFKELMECLDGITNIIIHYVEKAVADLEKNESSDDESILKKLVKINKKVAVVMCTDALFAGLDTTSATAAGTLYCLAKNQDKQDILRKELRRSFPNRDEALTAEKMVHMPYLRAVIKEGMRFYGPVAGTIRRITNDLVLSDHQVPKGANVLMMLVFPNVNEKYFGRASEFIPERWLKISEAACPVAKISNPFAFLPFGFGARMCVGKRLAEIEIEVLISRIIRDYKVEWNHPDMKVKSVLVNIPDGDLKFKMTEAQ